MENENVKCDFSHFTGISCGKSPNYHDNTLTIPISQCNKNTQIHLSGLQSLERSQIEPNSIFNKGKGLDFYNYPEALIILYRTGYFNIDARLLNLNICQQHRDYFGIYWRRSKLKCCYPEHPASSKAKVDRGASPRVCKEYWLKTREVINIGTGICKQCATRHREYFIANPLKVSSEADIELFERILNFNSTEEEHIQHTAEDNHMEIEDLNSQFSNFTQTTIDQSSQQTSSDWEKDNETDKDRFNRAMTILGKGNFENLLKCQLTLPWKDTSKSTKSLYLKVASEAVNLVLSHIVPGQVDTVFSEIVKKHDSYDENPTLDKQDILTRALVKAYLDQDNRQTQTQILSLFADKFSKENLIKLIPGVTISKIDAARRHASLESPGQMICNKTIYRTRLSRPKVLHFEEFISSPTYHQAVGYGSKKLFLSTGVEIVIPKVVRNIISARLIKTYLAFCEDQNFETFSRSTLFNILNVCISSQKKNLHGLDNITAEGMKAVDVLTGIVSKLQMFGLPGEKVDQLNNLMASLNQHLKFEIKGHLKVQSPCIDHCTVYSLSDPKSVVFQKKCDHEHCTGCEECEVVEKSLNELSESYQNLQTHSTIPQDVSEEIVHEIDRSRTSILAWKAHCVRTVHQDQAKHDILDQLKPYHALVVMDWAMKFLPLKHREAQSDFFGKKGIGWHVSSVITLARNTENTENKYDANTYIHIMELGTQGWFSVAHILTDLLKQLSSIDVGLKQVFLKSDNAGCYHSTGLIAYLKHLNTLSPITVMEYNFSEPQAGKDICDAKTAHCKMHIIRYSHEGHDVVTPYDMLTAIYSNGGIKGVIASVVSVDMREEVKMKTKIPNVSQMNNITFEANGVTFRKAYGIGKGYFMSSDQFKDHELLKGFEVQKPFMLKESFMPGSVTNYKYNIENTDVTTETDDFPIHVPNVMAGNSDNSDNEALFACPEQNCTKVYTKPHFLEQHICIGKHLYANKENSYDKVKLLWGETCVAVDHEHKVLLQSVMTTNLDIAEGWALKISKPLKRFSAKVKEFLHEIYMECSATGKRPNFDQICSNLKLLRNDDGTKKFNTDEWLTTSQVRSLFANFVKLGSKEPTKSSLVKIENLNEVDDEDLQNTLAEMDSADVHAISEDLATDIMAAIST